MISGQLKVEFRLIVFRPFVGEIIVAKLKESDANGLHLASSRKDESVEKTFLSMYKRSLWVVYRAHLCSPSKNVEGYSFSQGNAMLRNQGRWIWDFGEAGEAQSEEPRFVIDGTDQIKFRVHSVIYPSIPLEQPENSKPFAPMVITGSIDYDGLGPVSWWEEAEMVQEES